MHIEKFVEGFDRVFPPSEIAHVSSHLEDAFTRSFFDPCPEIRGMTSVKKQRLLELATAELDVGECYYEVGTYRGKSLVSALHLSAPRAYACDNFSEFQKTNSREHLACSLRLYGLDDMVTLLDGNFQERTNAEYIHHPVGVYFYDGAHDYESQYQAIRLVEPLLAERALVIVDDWRFAEDSQSFARAATENAIADSKRYWTKLYELPARHNGDHSMWWNGVAVFSSVKTADLVPRKLDSP